MGTLTHKAVENAKPKQKTYLMPDGNGLNLQIDPTGNKYWIFRYRFNNKERRISLGSAKKVSLQQSRLLAMECHKDIANHVDPKLSRQEKKAEQKGTSSKLFKNVAEEWFQNRVKANLAISSLGKYRFDLDHHILPALGGIQIHQITRKDCIKLQESIEKRNTLSTSLSVRGLLNQIFNLAIAKELCDANPASTLTILAIPKPPSKAYPHLLEPELPLFLQSLSSTQRATFPTRVAAWMTLLTTSRPNMVACAKWEEIDFEKTLWTISGEKMKMGRSHTISLPSQLLILLKELYLLTGRQPWLFPGQGSNLHMARNNITHLFQLIGYKGKMVGHGSRHTASTLLREHMWPKDFVEAQLAHKEGGVAGIYNQAVYIKYRTQMMQWYADYLDALRDGLTEEKADEFERRRVQTLFGIAQEPLAHLPTGESFANKA